jgi:hypothetical protein
VVANRFTDSKKWDDPFLLEIEPKYKLLWVYILDKCNHAGIYKQCSALEKCCLGYDFNWMEVEKVFKGRVVQLKDQKYFIPGFVEFQYGDLNPENRVHKSVLDILTKEGAYKGLIRTIQGRKDKDYDKDKDNIKINNNHDTDKDNCSSDHDKDKTDNDIGKWFEEFWAIYPKPIGQSMAYITFKATVKTKKDFQDIKTALNNYKMSKDFKTGFVKNGDRWMEDWRGWLKLGKKTGIERYEVAK